MFCMRCIFIQIIHIYSFSHNGYNRARIFGRRAVRRKKKCQFRFSQVRLFFLPAKNHRTSYNTSKLNFVRDDSRFTFSSHFSQISFSCFTLLRFTLPNFPSVSYKASLPSFHPLCYVVIEQHTYLKKCQYRFELSVNWLCIHQPCVVRRLEAFKFRSGMKNNQDQ